MPDFDGRPVRVTVPALSESDLATAVQRRRRTDILDRAEEVARSGGYDGVHMRDVARLAGVAMGTLYRYFPSKIHLLVAILSRDLERFEVFARRSLSGVDDPYDRLRVVIGLLTAEMQSEPELTDALSRAFVQASVAWDGDMLEVRDQLSDALAVLMSADPPCARHRDIGEMFADIWTNGVLGLAVKVHTVDEVRNRLNCTIDLVRRTDPSAVRTHAAIGRRLTRPI